MLLCCAESDVLLFDFGWLRLCMFHVLVAALCLHGSRQALPHSLIRQLRDIEIHQVHRLLAVEQGLQVHASRQRAHKHERVLQNQERRSHSFVLIYGCPRGDNFRVQR